MTDRAMTPQEIEESDARYVRALLHLLTAGLIPAPPERETEMEAEA